MSVTSPIKVEIDNDVATLRIRPYCPPLLGLCLIASISLLTFLLLGGLDNLEQVSWLLYAAAWAVGSGLFFIGLLLLYASRYPAASFSDSARIVRINRWSPLPTHRDIPWEQVLALVTTTSGTTNGTTVFGLALLLKTGEQVKLTSRTYSDAEGFDNAARQLNSFMAGH